MAAKVLVQGTTCGAGTACVHTVAINRLITHLIRAECRASSVVTRTQLDAAFDRCCYLHARPATRKLAQGTSGCLMRTASVVLPMHDDVGS